MWLQFSWILKKFVRIIYVYLFRLYPLSDLTSWDDYFVSNNVRAYVIRLDDCLKNIYPLYILNEVNYPLSTD